MTVIAMCARAMGARAREGVVVVARAAIAGSIGGTSCGPPLEGVCARSRLVDGPAQSLRLSPGGGSREDAGGCVCVAVDDAACFDD